MTIITAGVPASRILNEMVVKSKTAVAACMVAILSAAIVFLSALSGGVFFAAGHVLTNLSASRGRPRAWIALTIVSTIPLLFVEPFVLPSGSTENTLLVGDRFLVQRLPKPVLGRGTLIAFFYPVNRGQIQVKCVIGVANDRIKMVNRVVYRNGLRLDEP